MKIHTCLAIFILFYTALPDKPRLRPPVITFVTALYDIGRGQASYFARPFEQYLHFFEQVLHTRNNLIVYGDKSLKSFVFAHRPYSNTVFVEQPIDKMLNKWWFGRPLQALRTRIMASPTGRYDLFRTPQYLLKDYNVIMMAKAYMVEEAYRHHDIWGSDFINWFDAGGIHVFDDIISDKSEQETQQFQLLSQQTVSFYYFVSSRILYFNSTLLYNNCL